MKAAAPGQDVIDVCERSPDYIRGIAPYQPGKPISELARELGLQESGIIKLASNENPRGASPKAVAAMRAAIGETGRYPDGNGFALKDALSRRFGLSAGSNRDRQRVQRCAGDGSAGFPCAGKFSGVFGACIRRLSAGDAGDWRHGNRSAGARFRSRPGRDAKGDKRRYSHRICRQSEQSDGHLDRARR